MIEVERFKWLGPLFIAFEAVMHVYLVGYLVLEKASLLAIGFTIFELTMFCWLLIERKILHRNERNSN